MLTKKSFDDVVFPAIYKMGDYFSSFGGSRGLNISLLIFK